MKNYTKFETTPNTRDISSIEASHFFNFDKFRKSKDGGIKEENFIYKFTERAMFSNFIENRYFGKSEFDDEILFFDSSLQEKRTKRNPTLLKNYTYGKIVNSMTPQTHNIEPNAKF